MNVEAIIPVEFAKFIHCILFDRVTKKRYATIPCTELGIAIATAKAQKDLAIGHKAGYKRSNVQRLRSATNVTRDHIIGGAIRAHQIQPSGEVRTRLRFPSAMRP